MRLDIGDATGAGYDTLQFVRDHHDRLHSVYLKDRRKDRTRVPWGKGHTPIRPILLGDITSALISIATVRLLAPVPPK